MRVRRKSIIDSIFIGFMILVFAIGIGMLFFNWIYMSSKFAITVEYGLLVLVSMYGFVLWRRER